MRHLAIFITLMLFSLCTMAQGQSDMRWLTIHDGLAGESVYKIFKSRWEVMWIATTNGVTSYDGQYLKSYRVGEQRSKNIVYDIAQANDGYLWLATVDGVYKVDGTKKWLVRALPKVKGNLSSIKIKGSQAYIGGSDGLYIGSTESDNQDVRHIWLSNNHLPGNNKINDLFINNNIVWILSNYEIYQYDITTGKIKCLNVRQNLHISTPLRMMCLSGNRVFIGTFNDGMLVYDIKTGKILPYLDVDCRVITCLSADKNNLYVGTDGSGLHVISLKYNKIIQTYSTSEESKFRLKDNTVYAFYHDKSGVNFFGYYRQGLQYNYYKKPVFHIYGDTYGKNIRSICINGKIKVLGSRGGLWYIDEEKGIEKFFSPKELGGSIVTNVVEYAGQYYCCTFNGGVMRIDPKTLTTSRFGKSMALRTSSFGCLTVSPNNELWMSGNAGVYIYNAYKNTERHFDSKNSKLPNAYCNNILFDRQGRCWISSAQGFCLYDPLDNEIHDSGFPEGFFNQQRETVGALGDKDNLLFFGLDGLFRTNEEMTEFSLIDNKTPMVKQYISQVIYDKRHRHYWIATESGMFRFNADFKDVHKYASEAGLNSQGFSSSAIYIDDRNTLWIGTMNGLYYVNLDEVENYSIGNDRIVLDNILLGNSEGNDDAIVAMVRNNTIKLLYHWGAERLSFNPVLLNYCDQSELCFEYRIGNEGDWTQQNGHEDITIDGLSIGQNILQVRVAGSKEFTEYKVNVFPSGWFIFEWIGIFFLINVLVLVIRQRRMVLRQREQMLLVQKELEEAKKKYNRVNTNEDEQQRLLRRLEEYMKAEKPYLQTDMKLSDIASRLDVSTVKLSQLFNVYLNKTYYDFINQYRLDEFKSHLKDKKYANYTLLALAEECGFKRSSFFATFKKVEGVTPTEYAKKVRSSCAP